MPPKPRSKPSRSTPIGKPVIYRLDGDDRFVFGNEAWDAFAKENGAPELAGKNLVGQPVWLHIGDFEAAGVYGKIFSRVRKDRVRVRLPFCCDSPDLRRYMRMEIRPWRGNGLEIRCHLLRVKKRRNLPLRDVMLHDRQRIRMCGWCLRVEGPAGTWRVLETYVRKARVMEWERVPRILHGICPRCMKLIKKAAGLPD